MLQKFVVRLNERDLIKKSAWKTEPQNVIAIGQIAVEKNPTITISNLVS